MKRNLMALALVLFFGNVLFASAQVAPAQAEPTVPATLVVSEYGTLLNVLNADGTSRFGTLYRDGFLVRYSLGGAMKSVQAIGATAGGGLQSGQVTVEGNSTIVTVKTADDALEITSRFTFYKAARMESIIIRRSFKNTSSGEFKVVATALYLDPKVIGGGSLPLGENQGVGARLLISQASQRREANRLKQEADGRVTVFSCENCQLFERPPHDPPCFTIFCWETSALRPLVTTTAQEISVEWKPRTTALPMPSPVIESDSTTESDNRVNGKHFVVAVRLKGR